MTDGTDNNDGPVDSTFIGVFNIYERTIFMAPQNFSNTKTDSGWFSLGFLSGAFTNAALTFVPHLFTSSFTLLEGLVFGGAASLLCILLWGPVLKGVSELLGNNDYDIKEELKDIAAGMCTSFLISGFMIGLYEGSEYLAQFSAGVADIPDALYINSLSLG